MSIAHASKTCLQKDITTKNTYCRCQMQAYYFLLTFGLNKLISSSASCEHENAKNHCLPCKMILID